MKGFEYKKLWACSDIHGHYDELVELLNKIGFMEGTDIIERDKLDGKKLVFVGDYIDRGPKPLEVLLLVQTLVEHKIAKAVLGNHDSWYYRKLKGGDIMMTEDRKDTLSRIKSSELYWIFPEIEAELLEFLDKLPMWVEVDGVKFSHARYSHSAAQKDKKNQRHMMYGPTLPGKTPEGYPNRDPWYERYDGEHGLYVFGHYSLAPHISEFPHAVSVDCGVFKTGVLGAYEVHSKAKVYVGKT